MFKQDFMAKNEPQYIQRIRQELQILKDKGDFEVEIMQEGDHYYVLYKDVKTGGSKKGLPVTTNVLVPVPQGYPSSLIDMPALPSNSPLIGHVAGAVQQHLNVGGIQWSVLSYHPYTNGGGPPWNPLKHGFHDYYNHVFTWLHNLR
jgi:hypothetical protein